MTVNVKKFQVREHEPLQPWQEFFHKARECRRCLFIRIPLDGGGTHAL